MTTTQAPNAPAAEPTTVRPPSGGGRDLFAEVAPVNSPARVSMGSERTPDACVMVIFGVTGDLTARKLMPALWDLAVGHPLPEGFSIVGVARRPWTNEEFREEMRAAVIRGTRTPFTEEAWKTFSEGLFYVQGDFATPQTYTDLRTRLESIDETRGTLGNRLFYLATSPNYFADIIENLGSSGVAERREIYSDPHERWNRVVVEKPFGHDVESARQLIQDMATVFSEQQIFRIDHYLGKETVQNVMAFRFANVLFEPVFNRSYVEQVQITAAESIGVEGRGGYYEDSGALRDMVQSHLLQLLTVIAMEPPAVFGGDELRDEKIKVLRSVVAPSGDQLDRLAVRGQYGAGHMGGKEVGDYLSERGVRPGSQTETYVALKLEIDNWRWANVPFFLRTGKRLPRRVTEIAITFKKVPHLMFRNIGDSVPGANVITMRIQPDEGIALRFTAKVPGAGTRLRNVPMDFYYGSTFNEASPDAYERLIFDAMLGDPTLFQRRDEVETAWGIVQPVLDGWAEGLSPTRIYESGTWGPAEADAMLRDDGFAWRRP